MRGPPSAFQILELEPGSDRASVDRAYRRLMKQHHPDMQGGDPQRAAEINRAYRELRDEAEAVPGAIVRPRPVRKRRARPRLRRRSRKPLLGALGVLGAVVLVHGDPRGAERLAAWTQSHAARWLPQQQGRGPVRPLASLEAPLASGAILAASNAALRLSVSGEGEALVAWSRQCHRRLRLNPALALFDQCAAFDDAAATVLDGDPLQESGPFGAPAVTARAMTAATLLSDDYLAIERRLVRIRAAVEGVLMPPAPEPPVARADRPLYLGEPGAAAPLPEEGMGTGTAGERPSGFSSD